MDPNRKTSTSHRKLLTNSSKNSTLSPTRNITSKSKNQPLKNLNKIIQNTPKKETQIFVTKESDYERKQTFIINSNTNLDIPQTKKEAYYALSNQVNLNSLNTQETYNSNNKNSTFNHMSVSYNFSGLKTEPSEIYQQNSKRSSVQKPLNINFNNNNSIKQSSQMNLNLDSSLSSENTDNRKSLRSKQSTLQYSQQLQLQPQQQQQQQPFQRQNNYFSTQIPNKNSSNQDRKKTTLSTSRNQSSQKNQYLLTEADSEEENEKDQTGRNANKRLNNLANFSPKKSVYERDSIVSVKSIKLNENNYLLTPKMKKPKNPFITPQSNIQKKSHSLNSLLVTKSTTNKNGKKNISTIKQSLSHTKSKIKPNNNKSLYGQFSALESPRRDTLLMKTIQKFSQVDSLMAKNSEVEDPFQLEEKQKSKKQRPYIERSQDKQQKTLVLETHQNFEEPLLLNEQPQNIRIRCYANEFNYFKIKVKGKPCPLRLEFLQFNSKNKQVKFKIYVSQTSDHPNKFNCEQELNNNMISLSEPKVAYFTQITQYFITYIPYDDTFIKVSYHFGIKQPTNQEIDNFIHYKEEKILQKNGRINLKAINSDLLKDQVQKILYKKKQQFNLKNLDFEKLNKLNTQSPHHLNPNTQRQLNTSRHQNVIKNFTERTENHIQSLALDIKRRQIQKIINSQQKYQQIIEFKKNCFAFYWLTTIKMAIIASNARKIILKQKHLHKKIRDQIIFIKRPFFRYRYYTRPFRGGTLESRALGYIKESLEHRCQIVQQKQEEKAVLLILKFLKDQDGFIQLNFRMQVYYRRAMYAKFKMQSFHYKVIHFKQMVSKMWDKYLRIILRSVLDIREVDTEKKIDLVIKQLAKNNCKEEFVNNFYEHRIQQYRENFQIRYGENKNAFSVLNAFCDKKIEQIKNNDQNTVNLSQVDLEIEKDLQALRNKQLSCEVTAQVEYKNENDMLKVVVPRVFIFPSYQELKQIISDAIIYLIEEKKVLDGNSIRVKNSDEELFS